MLFLKSLIVPLVFVVFVFGYSWQELRYELSDIVPLDAKQMNELTTISYSTQYTFSTGLKFRQEIANQDQSKKAVIYWPKEPYTRILILAKSEQVVEAGSEVAFTGRLVRCVYRCMQNDMLLEMNDFITTLEDRFPDYKEKPLLMPTMVLDTWDAPRGFLGYLSEKKSDFLLALTSGVIFSVIIVFNGLRLRRSRQIG